MADEAFINECKSELLIECYTMALKNESHYEIRSILEEKLHRLNSLQINRTEPKEPVVETTVMQKFCEITEALSQTDDSIDLNIYKTKIESMPECSEKHYLLAVVELAEGRDEQHRINASKQIAECLKYEPYNLVYRMLANILLEADN